MQYASGKQIRKLILETAKRANVGHIGSALSVSDLIATLFDGVVNGIATDDPERDRFIMSKGHAALALYAALFLKGVISRELLYTYCMNGSILGTHPEHKLEGIDFSTGSLGQGLSIAVGSALAARISGSKRKTFVLVSDAECNEGSLWEGVMFAGHHHLSALTAIVDNNYQQALGYTHDVLSQDNASARWQAFGWDVTEVDGHDSEALKRAFAHQSNDKPRVIIANTQAGYGVSFMNRQIAWHYLPMTDEQFQQACREVEKS